MLAGGTSNYVRRVGSVVDPPLTIISPGCYPEFGFPRFGQPSNYDNGRRPQLDLQI